MFKSPIDVQDMGLLDLGLLPANFVVWLCEFLPISGKLMNFSDAD